MVLAGAVEDEIPAPMSSSMATASLAVVAFLQLDLIERAAGLPQRPTFGGAMSYRRPPLVEAHHASPGTWGLDGFDPTARAGRRRSRRSRRQRRRQIVTASDPAGSASTTRTDSGPSQCMLCGARRDSSPPRMSRVLRTVVCEALSVRDDVGRLGSCPGRSSAPSSADLRRRGGEQRRARVPPVVGAVRDQIHALSQGCQSDD